MIKIICNRCNKPIESIQKVGFIQFCYQNPFESVTDDNISKRNHYCEDCMTEIEQFMRNDGGRVINKVENMRKALNDALHEVHEMSGVINVPVLNIPQIDTSSIGDGKDNELRKTPLLEYIETSSSLACSETLESEEKHDESEARTSRCRIDYDKIMSLRASGMKNKDIAAQMGMTPQEVATAVYTYKKRNGMETGRKESTQLKSKPKKPEESHEQEKKVDIGKIRALHNAKWGVAAIAGEMGMKESEIIDILESVNNADAG